MGAKFYKFIKIIQLINDQAKTSALHLSKIQILEPNQVFDQHSHQL